ncbi:hypothetical protein EXIGLDRAFT_339296 [Exidia glandulosa HHB12029]|uniref:Amine oxidase domain-containing protein n=1 Tax=Exidia glandulosa HHB12029 TaxID=1314781 RepID=A0A165CJW6_EXIGL|nr:hypothetical protein EXIGLDRAFT_339296 [Exidia glandulosa HHB12029]
MFLSLDRPQLPGADTTPDTNPTVQLDSYRSAHARSIIRQYLTTFPAATLEKARSVPTPAPTPPQARSTPTPPQVHAAFAERPAVVPVKVGIIGAGAAGLYAAMILDTLRDEGFEYEILEADPERVGGRMYTHHFEKGAAGPNDYYDIGAMRFPKIPFMDKTFELFGRVGITPIPYVMSIPQNIRYYNEKGLTVQAVKDSESFDPFGTGVDGLTAKADTMADDQLGVFKAALIEDFPSGWKKLMEYDSYSTRDYMMHMGTDGVRYPDKVVDFLETFETASNLYDQAVTESVMDSLDFDYGPDVDWFCIQGGAQQVAERMAEGLKGSLLLGKRVKAIAFDKPSVPGTLPNTMSVTVANEEQPRTYDHVITTVPFGCLRMIDTTGCYLPWNLQTAMRTLHYDCATKVAIQFSRRWWEEEDVQQYGGVSSTDRPTRTVVYPSYGIRGQGGAGASMIVSYTWAQDAARFGALIQPGTEAERRLIDQILADLAVMHNKSQEDLENMMVDYHAFDWYNHENSAGAYAMFGPGQFANLFPEVSSPHGRLLHFAGEATSVHHAWIVGALNSAYRSVHQILHHYKREDLVARIRQEFGAVDEIDDPAFEHLQLKLAKLSFQSTPFMTA